MADADLVERLRVAARAFESDEWEANLFTLAADALSGRGALPDGWVIVPREPTDEILLAALIARHNCKEHTPLSAFAVTEILAIRGLYKAMLAARPENPK